MAPSSDEYERRFMAGGQALARSRVRMPGWFFLLFALPLLGAVCAAVVGAAPAALIVAAIETPLLVALSLIFSHLRLTLSSTHLHVQYGLWGPKIRLDRIESVSLEDYDWKQYGGWGLRRGRNGVWAYSVPGAGKTVLAVQHRDDAGELRKFVVSVDDPAAMLFAIERARGVSTGVRVDANQDVISAPDIASTTEVIEAPSSSEELPRTRGR